MRAASLTFVHDVLLRLMHRRACAAIAKRVVGLLAVALVGGVVLFYAGLSALR